MKITKFLVLVLITASVLTSCKDATNITAKIKKENLVNAKSRDSEIKKGAASISFDKKEVRFNINKQNEPIGVYVKESKESNKLVEEFMLLANRKVSEYVGKKIKKGDTIMIVEAMKTMNHVPSTADGVVKEICVEDGHPVEFGQTIIVLE